ncbi:MAG: hypothetical protein LBJ23_04915 [Tannerella sp.]|nr:hypothetical protein [Tannerella sp.]
MQKYCNLLLLLTVAALACSCRMMRPTTLDSFYNSEVECLGVGYDGSQTLRVWGTGGSEANAVEDAHKKAVYTVLFKGIVGGPCASKPVVTEVNAFERHREYFDGFFARRGAYRRFVGRGNEQYGSRMVEYNAIQTKYGVTVTVSNSQLRKQLVKDGIIKQ